MSKTPAFLVRARQRFERALPLISFNEDGAETTPTAAITKLIEASNYSLGNGGKRIRPALVYFAARAVTDDAHPALDYVAVAMEMIHCYSLVHDDLPAMDDDDMRRGKPSCHRAYDEATAILVGDGLQARAFELLAKAPELEPATTVELIRELAAAAGPFGMVGGQAVDMHSTGRSLDLPELKSLHALKTGRLIRAALRLGGIVAGADNRQLASLTDYGDFIGLAFQVVDDILDVEGNSASLGKTAGKDKASNKATYVTLLGLEDARIQGESLHQSAVAALQPLGEKADKLRDLADFILLRQA